MRRERAVHIFAVVALIGCMAASGLLTGGIAASAGRHRLVYTDSAEEGQPKEVAIGIAMGAFRGLFVNFLWMRANERKQEGRYFDAVDLAKTITRLQPRYPRVWAFHAWNLAYNISVATNTQEERWNWVQAGIRLLRDQGIPANPNDMILHKELAWIFIHKVQGFMDDANLYYKKMHAREWTIVLGAPPRRTADNLDTDKRVQQMADWLGAVNLAPSTLTDLEQNNPRAHELLARLRDEARLDLTGSLYNERGTGPGEQLLAFVETERSLSRVVQAINVPIGNFAGNALAAHNILTDPQFHDARVQLVLHVRKRLLVDKYHMEPDRMISCTLRFGPLDWRHPAAHAIYWASRGVEMATLRATKENRGDFDFLNTDRLVVQAIQEMRRSGDLYFDFLNREFLVMMPSIDYIPYYGREIEEMIKRGGIFTDPVKRIYTPYAAGYENFLKDSVRFLYQRGYKEEADKYFNMLINFNKQNMNDPMRAEGFNHPLGEWVALEISNDDRYTVPDVARDEVVASLQSAYINGLLLGNSALFRSELDYAHKFHSIFIEKQVKNTAVNQQDAARMQVMDPDFQKFAGQVLALVINTTASGFDGPIMYQRAPVELQLPAYAYLEMMPVKEQLGDDPKSGFNVMFPPPPGIEEYRAKLRRGQAPPGDIRNSIERK